jgi:hypothetical protein
VIDPKFDAYFYSWQPLDLLAEGASSYARDFEFKLFRFLLVLLGPIVGVWMSAAAVGWVIQGFKRPRA